MSSDINNSNINGSMTNNTTTPTDTNKKPIYQSDSQNNNTHHNNHSTTHIQLAIEGMSCQACATRIEKVLNKKPAISQASVNFAGETANIDYDPNLTSIEEIVSWVTKTGFQAHAQQDEDFLANPQDKQANQPNNLAPPWRLIAIWLCLLPFLWGMAGMLFGQGMAMMPPVWLQFVLATVVQFGLALPFYKSAWQSIKGGVANMDVLVILGTLTIWTYSTYTWLTHGGGAWLQHNIGLDLSAIIPAVSTSAMSQVHHAPVYFEAGVMILAFIRLGKYLEARTKKHSLDSIDMLLSLTPQTVEKQTQQGKFETVALSQVAVGDYLRAKQGSRIATDGVVVSGEGWCDESHLTGESVALDKKSGDTVLAGAMMANGSLVYQVQATGHDTQLGDMVKALSDAQGSKAHLARLADKVASIFVPTVVGLSLLTFAVTWWLTGQLNISVLHAVSVLVIACPCALGLATPAAIMAGMGVAARHGVWFKDAPSLEAAGSIDTVVLDKTGTLTVGKPVLVDQVMVDKSLVVNDVLQLVASVEAHASHPLATALVNVAKERGLTLLNMQQVQVVEGQGVQAQLAGLGVVKVGTADFVKLELPKLMPKVWQIASTVAVSVNDEPLGAFALADDLKADSKQAISVLQQSGLQVILMSGDKNSVVNHVASQLDIEQAYGEMSPRDKAEQIARLQANGHQVAMVGDGVNDAPAMATANASFAMYEGTDVAQHSASARLMGESLLHINAAQKIAKATVRNIKQNLFFAFIYNIIGIPLAAFGLLNPMIAAAAMTMSSISVLFNALRLNRLKITVDEKSI